MINVVIIDDHELIRDGYKHLFRVNNKMELISCFCNGYEFLEFIDKNPNQHIDIALIDFQMPTMNGIELIKKIKELKLNIKTILVSHHSESFLIESSFLNGGNGYLTKGSDFELITEAIEQVYNNGYYIPYDTHKDFIKSIINKDSLKPKYNFVAEISEREKEVAILISHGFSYKEIADKLGISKRTVEEYKNNFCKKTGVSKQAGIAVYCVYMGWI